MYSPHPFRVTDSKDILAFVKAHSLASIVSNHSDFPVASHIPLIVQEVGEKVKLIGHFANANSQLKILKKDPNVLLMFHGAQSYISTYAKDPENLSILPTWDYQMVHGWGKLSFLDDDGLLGVLQALMGQHETDEPKKMQLSKYPEDVLQRKLQLITGFEITVDKWMGCFRLNQNRTKQERKNIMDHLADNVPLVEAIAKYGSESI